MTQYYRALHRLASRRRPGGDFIADLSSQASVRTLAAEVLARHPKLDVLVNNAGAMYGTRQPTKDGIELTWAVNHLAPFLVSELLVFRLKGSALARIITTASQAHYGEEKTRICKVPEGEFDFLGYSVLQRHMEKEFSLKTTVS